MKKLVVIKFGGTSVNNQQKINTLSEIVIEESKKRNVIVVVSAIRGITDLLISLENKNSTLQKEILFEIKKIHLNLSRELFKDKKQLENVEEYISSMLFELQKHLTRKLKKQEWMDKTVSYGEILSSYIITAALSQKNVPSVQVIATDIIVTDNNFGSAEFIANKTEANATKKLLPIIKGGVTPVVTGFIGATTRGETTTLGRGGSDYSATILAYALGASEIQIWTDVNGIHTADPRIVKQAIHVGEISYREASEMAFFGAKILHPRTIHPAIKAEIPVRILNTNFPKFPGTTIVKKRKNTQSITAISSKRDAPLVNIYATEMLLSKGFLEKIFGIFSKYNISIDLVSVSEVSVSLTLDNCEQLEQALTELQKFSITTVIKNVSIISLIGEGISKDPEILSLIFSTLYKKSISVKMISFGAINTNISLVVDEAAETEAVKTLHNKVLLRKLKENK